jgi:hypothetical protein
MIVVLSGLHWQKSQYWESGLGLSYGEKGFSVYWNLIAVDDSLKTDELKVVTNTNIVLHCSCNTNCALSDEDAVLQNYVMGQECARSTWMK